MPSQVTLILTFLLFKFSIFITTFVSITTFIGNPIFFFRSDLRDFTESASTTCEPVDSEDRISVMFLGSLVNNGKDPLAISRLLERAVMEMGS